jgi:hypothetical protein
MEFGEIMVASSKPYMTDYKITQNVARPPAAHCEEAERNHCDEEERNGRCRSLL